MVDLILIKFRDNRRKQHNHSTTGRMKPEESQMFNHIPWVMWREWIDILSQFNVGVQLGTVISSSISIEH